MKTTSKERNLKILRAIQNYTSELLSNSTLASEHMNKIMKDESMTIKMKSLSQFKRENPYRKYYRFKIKSNMTLLDILDKIPETMRKSARIDFLDESDFDSRYDSYSNPEVVYNLDETKDEYEIRIKKEYDMYCEAEKLKLEQNKQNFKDIFALIEKHNLDVNALVDKLTEMKKN